MSANKQTIDLTPTWESLMPMLVHVAANGSTKEGREEAAGQLLRLARIVDQHIAKLAVLQTRMASSGLGEGIVCPDCGIRGRHAFGCPQDPATKELKLGDVT